MCNLNIGIHRPHTGLQSVIHNTLRPPELEKQYKAFRASQTSMCEVVCGLTRCSDQRPMMRPQAREVNAFSKVGQHLVTTEFIACIQLKCPISHSCTQHIQKAIAAQQSAQHSCTQHILYKQYSACIQMIQQDIAARESPKTDGFYHNYLLQARACIKKRAKRAHTPSVVATWITQGSPVMRARSDTSLCIVRERAPRQTACSQPGWWCDPPTKP